MPCARAPGGATSAEPRKRGTCRQRLAGARACSLPPRSSRPRPALAPPTLSLSTVRCVSRRVAQPQGCGRYVQYICSHVCEKRAHTPHARGRWRAVRDSRRGRRPVRAADCAVPRSSRGLGTHTQHTARGVARFTQSARSTARVCVSDRHRRRAEPWIAHRRFFIFRPRAWCTHKSGSLPLPSRPHVRDSLSLLTRRRRILPPAVPAARRS